MKRLLVLCDDIWHPADVIEKGLDMLETEELKLDFVRTAKDILTPEMIAQYPLIFCCKGNTINAANTAPWFEKDVTEVGPKELKEYVENGGTYVAVHAGSDVNPEWVPQEPKFYEEAKAYNELVGCSFESHPPRCRMDVHIVAKDHPLMEGVTDFSERDEQYHMKMLKEDYTLLMESTTEEGGTVPCGWMFPVGRGTVIVITPGHTLAILKNPAYQQVFRNIIHEYLLKE